MSLGGPWASLGGPWGVPEGSLGILGGSLGVPGRSLGVLGGSLGGPWGILGCFERPLREVGPLREVLFSVFTVFLQCFSIFHRSGASDGQEAMDLIAYGGTLGASF